MRRRTFWATVSAVAMVVIAILTLSSVAASASAYKILHVFVEGGQDGQEPHQNLVFDAAGNLYGTTQAGAAYGHGMVFKLAPNQDGTWTESVLYNFTGGQDGGNSVVQVTFDVAGNLYGTTEIGGAYGDGVVFKLAANPDGTWTESVIHSLDGTDGASPYATVIFDAAGNLYGTAWTGGAYGAGVVFKLTANLDGSWTQSVLHSFTGGSDGASPYRELLFDSKGNLYGTAGYGGADGAGVVFEMTPDEDGTWTETVLHSFSGLDGSNPQTPLALDKAGNLYGTAFAGGAYGYGVVFELTPDQDGTWTESVLHGFDYTDGANSYDGLTFDRAGNLYGTTNDGGAFGAGVVFGLARTSNGWHERVLHSFRGFGSWPQAGITLDAAGNLYGTTWGGSNNGGLVFESAP